MNFAPFTPYEEPFTTRVTTGGVEGLVAALGPTAKKLRSDYSMTTVFYYISDRNAVVEIETVKKVMRKPNSDVEDHIRELNGLPRMR